jgi:osmoprotectant transport system substrate-binding protein
MRKHWKGAAAVFAAVAVAIVLVGCTTTSGTPAGSTTPTGAVPAGTKGPIVVGSKIDTEGKLLGTIIKLMLEANGFTVVDKIQTGPTDVVRQALINGEIDIYPEYTGSGLLFFKGKPGFDPATFKNPEAGYAYDKTTDLAENSVVWLTPAKANNTWALAVTTTFANANNLKTMSDMAAYVKAGKPTKVAASDEFFNNPDAWPAFAKTYLFDLKPAQRLVLSGGDTAQTEKAVADGTNGVNFGMAYGTDGALSSLGLVVLTDDKDAQVVYWPCPTARKTVTDKYPEIETILAPPFEGLTLQKLQELNGRIQVGGEQADAVARDYLTSGGYLK